MNDTPIFVQPGDPDYDDPELLSAPIYRRRIATSICRLTKISNVPRRSLT
jgi:hypothetical protein